MPPGSRPFDPSRLRPTLIDLALQDRLDRAAHPDPFSVLLELRHGAHAADLLELAPSARAIGSASRGLFVARLTKAEILQLAERGGRVLYRIWLNHPVRALAALPTIQADAAMAGFAATGKGIVWAVADSGIAPHAHFDQYGNLELPPGIEHRDFTGGGAPLADEFGHGTHVAGILAGCPPPQPCAPPGADPASLRGVAPETKIVSLKVLGPDGAGEVSSILAALDYVQQVNDHGRRLLIHGINLSLGYEFDPEWFACGASPLCQEIDRLVLSGVSVVVAAGNSGYGWQNSLHTGVTPGCLDLTINDPGNAELAITVGSTHRERPHTYGVSYFSSKGPTGDGRMKPDLVAPGERILTCAAPSKAPAGADWRTSYVEDSGTSMAAPHVSGAIAAFLSVRREFIGRPLDVKEIFLSSATDLRRAPNFQGRGLLNLFRALQQR
ncbi:MAG: S8 family peptidase [Bryobacteraceae bacterium]|nr:S8 family peptidase [Bryobacteraceae bacterium]